MMEHEYEHDDYAIIGLSQQIARHYSQYFGTSLGAKQFNLKRPRRRKISTRPRLFMLLTVMAYNTAPMNMRLEELASPALILIIVIRLISAIWSLMPSFLFAPHTHDGRRARRRRARSPPSPAPAFRSRRKAITSLLGQPFTTP